MIFEFYLQIRGRRGGRGGPLFEHLQCLILEIVCNEAYKNSSIKKVFLENFLKFTGKHLCRSLFLIKLQAFQNGTLDTGVFLYILQNF